MELVEISTPNFDVTIDIVYASRKNFTGSKVYKRPGCYLHPTAAELLVKAIQLAAQQNLKFKIYDAFRPTEAQSILWQHTPDANFLADPQTGSPHSRGIAVDLTLINTKGEVLEMGTQYDAFTPLSHHGTVGISPEAQKNRYILLGIMTAAGWDFYKNEWWHYQLFGPKAYGLLSDASLREPMM
ncbi:MAG: D-alanyl-D-alanine dipeptidase [Pseudomonadota bacterium]|nr:D-alanyl-D-alanine dipeptidase [Pseudomonadota bacterium]